MDTNSEMGIVARVTGKILPMNFTTDEGDERYMVQVKTTGDVVNITVPPSACERMNEEEVWQFYGDAMVSRPKNGPAKLRITRLHSAKRLAAAAHTGEPTFDFGDVEPKSNGSAASVAATATASRTAKS